MLDIPNELLTLHEYSPGSLLTDSLISSTLLYVEFTLLVMVCINLCTVPSIVISTPSLVHITLVGGEPVDTHTRENISADVFC